MSTIKNLDSTLHSFVKSPIKPNSKNISTKSAVNPPTKSTNKSSQVKTVSYTAPKAVDNTKIELELEELLNKGARCNDGRYIYTIFHIIMFLIAVYLSFRCNNKTFNLSSFLFAAFFPYVYIVYILATQGTCGLLE
jgi:hypothetical protein